MVQAGPGECQPDGVGPGVNHRLASPPLTVVVIPGLNGLALKDAVPVWFAVMSVILTVVGVQLTLEFQAPTRGAVVVSIEAKTGTATWIKGMRRRAKVIIAVSRENRTVVGTFYSPPDNIRDPGWIVTFSTETGRDPRPI